MQLNKCFPCLRFKNEEVIIKLDCSNTVLTENFPEVWQHERTLEELCLTSTRINNLPPQLFYCQSLRVLLVNNNNLESLPNAIGSLRQLHILNLSRNLISSVPDNIKTCKNLTILDLSCNNLQRLPDAITCLISLQELFLNETCLEFLPANFGRLVNLKILEIRLNNLITLPKSMARLSNLQRIDIGGNEFTELPEIVGELKQLRELWIDFNQIRRISPNIAKLRELKHFESNGNIIESLPNEISHWRNIEVLSICTNNLESFPFSLGMMKTLVTLKCESNELRELPDSISNLENLEELVLSHNQLIRLPVTIGMLKNLRCLFVDQNELRTLPKELCNCNNLSVLSVTSNKLTELPQNIGHLTRLKVLNLVNNYVSTLPASILNLVNLTSLWISDNQSQPLVPLQYLDANLKTQLTCFMLPQKNLRVNQVQEQFDKSYQTNDFTLNKRQYAPQLYKTEIETVNMCTSPSRRICFAEEATILTVAAVTSYNKTKAIDTASTPTTSTTLADETHLGLRLMRSPTPYPKELRLMSKYLRNSTQKLSHSSSIKPISVKEAHVILNTSNCDSNNLSTNDVQLLSLNETHILESKCSTYASTSQGHHHDLYGETQLQHQIPERIMCIVPRSINVNQLHHQEANIIHELQPSSENYYAAYYVAPTNSIYSNDIDHNYHNFTQHSETIRELVDSSFNEPTQLEPPPYHIARSFTKKSPEDLSNYESMRNRNQEIQDHLETVTNHDAASNEILSVELNSNCSEVVYRKKNIQQLNHSNSGLVLDTENNFLNSTSSTKAHQRPDNTAYNLQLQNQLNGSLSQLSICSSNSLAGSSVNTHSKANTNSKPLSNKKTPWLFGVHKNPTVKQVTINWENHVGFDISELPNKDGFIVSSTVPNTMAARLLYVNDKLLEIDGYDFLNMNLIEAKQVILNAGSVITIMLSRIE